MHKNRNLLITLLVSALAFTASCSHKATKKLVGSDRDVHGCLASAGYCWSEARKDCIRLWETGLLAQSDSDQLYVVFAPDSSMAEIFHEGRRLMCRKAGRVHEWRSDDESSWVSSDGTTVTVSLRGYEFYGDCK